MDNDSNIEINYTDALARLETEYVAATIRIDNDLLVIAELTAERDALKVAARLALDAVEKFIAKVDSGQARSVDSYNDFTAVAISFKAAGVK